MLDGFNMDTFITTPLVMVIVAVALMIVVVTAVVKVRRQPAKVNSGIRAVLITGCDSGFGFMTAKKLDALGFKVFASCLDCEGEGAKRLQLETSPKLHIIQLDVTKEDQIEAARMEVTECLMGNVLWAVINNSGVACHADFEWCPTSWFDHVMDVNFMGVVKITRAFLPLVRAAKGRVVNVASMAGRTAMPGFTAYSASKSAVIGFSESLRREMVHFEVKVILVEPSIYGTGFTSRDVIIPQNQNFWDSAEPGIKRDYGEAFFKATQESQAYLLSWANPKVEQVAKCIVDAASSTRPASRYAPPTHIRIMNDCLNMSWGSIQDWIIRCVVMGVKSKPAIVNPLLNADNGTGRNGRRRSHAT